MKTYFKNISALIFIFLMLPSVTFAAASKGVFLNLGLSYGQAGSANSSKNAITNASEKTETDGNELILNFSAGYAFGNNVLLGIKHFKDGSKINLKTPFIETETETDETATGIMLGYRYGSFIGQFSYLAVNTPITTVQSGSTNVINKYSDGSGFIIDLTYLIDLKGFFFGPQISYIEIEYASYDDGGITDNLFVSKKETSLKPQFAVATIF